MLSASAASPHTFVIPVMGTGFTLDTPIRVGRFGITSTVSLVDDVLMDQVRGAFLARQGRSASPIEGEGGEARAQRIEAYLNFLKDELERQMCELKASPLCEGSPLFRYFELLPPSPLRERFERVCHMEAGAERTALEDQLRAAVVPGAIDVNIMTKLDRRKSSKGVPFGEEDSDALAALRGFVRSKLRSSVVFSAGMNPRLFGYAARFDVFYPDAEGELEKRIVLKVSDFRSAVVQATFLAKKGLWVSEFRIESGLNCGGHAFASGGLLLGPILEQFRAERGALREQLFSAYAAALAKAERCVPKQAPAQRLTVQGGIGTHDEDRMLRERFSVDGTGWGSPFLMVPEATAVDAATRARLREAKPEDLQLSDVSPLGVRFWSLSSSVSEQARRGRVAKGKPGSICPKGFLATNEDATGVPVCVASRSYQRARLLSLEAAVPDPMQRDVEAARIVDKACICHDLGGSIAALYGLDDAATTAICPGPNIMHFKRELSLDDMVGHIYGRTHVCTSPSRRHVLLEELRLNLDYLDELRACTPPSDARAQKGLESFSQNLQHGIAFYLAELSIFGAQADVARVELRARLVELASLPEERRARRAEPRVHA